MQQRLCLHVATRRGPWAKQMAANHNTGTKMKLGFAGLGVMGFPMAGHLAAAGHQVAIYNRTGSVAERWMKTHRGALASTPAELASGAECVLICVGDDDDVRQVVTGPQGLLETMAAGAVIVDHTTTSATVARELAAVCASKGVGFVDAPVSGGQAGAENGQLTVMCGGTDGHYQQALPAIECYAKMVRRLGEVGSGQLCKMVNQICLAGMIQGLAEGLHFAERNGLDASAVVDVIGKGAAQSWQMDNRASTMIAGEYDFGFAVDWMRKDLKHALNQARDSGASVPIAALVDQFYADVQAMGGHRWDTSSLLQRLRNHRA